MPETSSAVDPVVDVVVAAHDTRRRVDRTVASVLDGTRTPVRVLVVSHHVPAHEMAVAIGSAADDERVLVVEHSDGKRSPSGPFNRGLTMGSSEFVMIIGSDDYLAPTAVDRWVQHARSHGTDYLIAPRHDQDGAVWHDPLSRRGRTTGLDLVRDRLAYRAAPLGLIRRSFLTDVGLLLTEDVPTGVDIELGLALLVGGGQVDSDPHLPPYVIGTDAPVRITLAPRPAHEELAALLHLVTTSWPRRLSGPQRNAIAVKLWRLNVVPAIVRRPGAGQWSPADLDALEAVTRWLRELAPGAEQSLSRPERRITDATAGAATATGLARAVASIGRTSRLGRVMTSRPWHLLDVDGPLRRELALRTRRRATAS